MNAQIKIYNDSGSLYAIENVRITNLEMGHGIHDLSTPHETRFIHSGYQSISLDGQIVDYIDRSRTLNRKALIV